MIAPARGRHPRLALVVASADALPFRPGSVDAALGNFLVHHLGHPDRVLAEFRRVLAAGGRLALTAWDLPQHCRLIGVMIDAIAEAGALPPADLPAGPPFFQLSADEAFGALFRGCGFVDVRVSRIAFEHPVASADELWNGLLDGTVRTSALVTGQPAAVRRRIRHSFDRNLAGYAVPAR